MKKRGNTGNKKSNSYFQGKESPCESSWVEIRGQ